MYTIVGIEQSMFSFVLRKHQQDINIYTKKTDTPKDR